MSMSLSQSVAQSATLLRLASIATQAADGGFDDIYCNVSELFETQGATFTPRERALAADILRRLSKDVEMSIRMALAERLADNPDAPRELLVLLADDRIEVARPVLARSPVLSDSDLVHVVEVGRTDHLMVVAERPSIGETVTAALARSQCEAIVIALLRNRTAKIAGETFGELVERARESEALHEPLLCRRDLPPLLASRMYGWVSEALKSTLTQRYPEFAAPLARAIDISAAVALSGSATRAEATATKLVAKLSDSGQLKASFLIRVLHQGQMDLFEHGLAAMLKMEVPVLRRAFYEQRPGVSALACRAAGIDRAVFLTVFNLSRHHRQASRHLTDEDRKEIDEIFGRVAKADALARMTAVA